MRPSPTAGDEEAWASPAYQSIMLRQSLERPSEEPMMYSVCARTTLRHSAIAELIVLPLACRYRLSPPESRRVCFKVIDKLPSYDYYGWSVQCGTTGNSQSFSFTALFSCNSSASRQGRRRPRSHSATEAVPLLVPRNAPSDDRHIPSYGVTCWIIVALQHPTI